jgi:hypothetical protein
MVLNNPGGLLAGQLPQHKVQNAAMTIVIHLFGGIQTAFGLELFAAAI